MRLKEQANFYDPFSSFYRCCGLLKDVKDEKPREKEVKSSSSVEEPKKEENIDNVSIVKKLSILDQIFCDEKVMNDVVLHGAIRELVDKEVPSNYGFILYGLPGTGKTRILNAVAKVYESFGQASYEINIAKTSEKYVSSLSHNLDAEIDHVLKEHANCSNIFIWMDEVSSLLWGNNKHQGDTFSYYQEGVDTLKKYIGNYPKLVFGIATNSTRTDFNDALVREGRLKPIEVGKPSKDNLKNIWKFCLKKYGIGELNECEIDVLSVKSEGLSGAFIDDCCKNFFNRAIYGENLNILESLKSGKRKTVEDVKKEFSSDLFVCYVEKVLKERDSSKKEMKFGFKYF